MPGIYLDNNATTRPLPEVVALMSEHWQEAFANPGSRHFAGRKARQVLESARESLAAILGAHPDEVIFTSGGTESNNLALLGLARNASPTENGSAPRTLALTAGEHPSVMEPCRHLARDGWQLHELPVLSDGRLHPDHVERLSERGVRLATVILAHNETGVVQDLRPLAEHCREQRIPLHTDAVQAVGKIQVNFHDLGVTTLSLAAHKFHGPRGVGALLLRRGCKLQPALFGGHQEAEHRPGTEAVPLIAGMARALELFDQQREARTRHWSTLRDRLEQGLQCRCRVDSGGPGTVINGSREHRLPNTLNMAFPGVDGEALLVALDLERIACSLGSTCASGSAEPAPALVAMGRPDDVLRSSVRFSVGLENTATEIDQAVETIAAVVRRLRTG